MTLELGYPELCRYLPVKLAPGIHHNVSRETYDSIPAMSATVIKKWLRYKDTPSVFKYWLDNRWDETPTEALIIGSALDCLRLDGIFSSKYTTVPPGAPKRPTKAQVNAKSPSEATLGAIAFWDKFQTENKGKTILTQEQLTRVLGMNKALREAPSLTGVFEHCRKTVLVGEIDGWPCKCEVDLWNDASHHVMDIKTAEDVGPKWFTTAIERFGYVTQAAFYLAIAENLGVEKHFFDFIAVGNEEPYPVRVHSLNTEDSGHLVVCAAELYRIKEALRELTRRLTEMDFSDDNDWHLIEFPEWKIAKDRNELETR